MQTITYPRKRNGSIDDGSPIKGKGYSLCPECRAMSVLETVSAQSCREEECGHVITDYWPDAVSVSDMDSKEPSLYTQTMTISFEISRSFMASDMQTAKKMAFEYANKLASTNDLADWHIDNADYEIASIDTKKA